MASARKKHLPIRSPAFRRIRYWCVAALVSAPICIIPAGLTAQQTPVYSAGNAAVTGFSGALPPVQIAPGVDPDKKTFIDLNGPSLRIVDLRNMGGPMQAQLVRAPKLFTFPAASIGQVFGVAIDDASPPNIYAAATSVYGLPIVAPGADGQAEHIPLGAPKAAFMPGLWGPQGGPGSIWKIDGVTGRVTLLANVTLNGRANSGAALGGLAYNPDSPSLYVADRESGMIHHLAMGGGDLGSYDHGVTPDAPPRGCRRCHGIRNNRSTSRARNSTARSRRAGIMRHRGGGSSGSPSTSIGCTTPSPTACKSGRSA
jgi:hypothetical protein